MGVKVTVSSEDRSMTPPKANKQKATLAKNRTSTASTPTKKKKSKASKPQAATTSSKLRQIQDQSQKLAYIKDDNDDGDSLFVKNDDPEYVDTGAESSDKEHDRFEEGLSESDAFSVQDKEDEGGILDVDVSLLDDRLNDIARHRQTLLQYAPGKRWIEKDLRDEQSLVVRLRLLYNRINGLELLHLTKSIHIYYKQFPKKSVTRVSKLQIPSSKNQAKAREKGLELCMT
jgi:hypothetical protein